jgi:hypothetical protein
MDYADRKEPVGLEQKKYAISSGAGDREKRRKKKVSKTKSKMTKM